MTGAAQNPPAMTVEQFTELIVSTLPVVAFFGIRADKLERGVAIVRLPYSARLLRPGGTHGGPAMMTLIDVAMYGAILSLRGDQGGALTTHLSTYFLQRPPAVDLLAHCRIIGIDATSAVGKATVYPDGGETTVLCAATCTYALPSSAKR